MADAVAARPADFPPPPWRIGVDVGGTFTDLVLRGGAGGLRVFKVPSVPGDPSQGVLAALDRAAAAADLGLPQLLGGCELFVHGSTVATNTILERKGAKVGLLATEGFRDSLEIRRGLRENMWDHRAPFPPVLVPRYLRSARRRAPRRDRRRDRTAGSGRPGRRRRPVPRRGGRGGRHRAAERLCEPGP